MLTTVEEAREALTACNQDHLLAFWDELSENEKQQFLQQLNTINFKEVSRLFDTALINLEDAGKKLDDLIQPVPDDLFGSEEGSNEETLNEYRDVGLKEISQNHVAVVLLAGGQGTRLGNTYPKGMFPLNLPSKKTLFQLQAERIIRLTRLTKQQTGLDCKIFWYIMTSEATHGMTVKYFEKCKYFGLNSDDVVFFQQGQLPCFDFNGKILLDKKNAVALSPDGNGGLYTALKKNKILEHMAHRGVKYVHTHSVDNILVKVADPVFIGYCISKEAECGAKVVKKSSPFEPVGVVCKVNNHFQVVEYSEITEKTAQLKDDLGNLVFRAGNICNHFFTTDFLVSCTKRDRDLKLHVARKKIPYVNFEGERVEPAKPNGVKIEKFIFDVFEFANKFVTWEVARHTDFSPLKNCDKIQEACPKTVREDLLKLHKKYVEDNGGKLEEGAVVEISPLLSYAGENLRRRVEGILFVKETVLRGVGEKL